MDSFAYFAEGLIVGIFWREIKWLTYDLLKAICRGVFNACRVMCFGELKPEYSRLKAIMYLPKAIWRTVGEFIKWEWLNGCRIN